MRKTKAERALEASFDQSYSRLGNGVQVSILNLGKMKDEAVAAIRGGATADEAVAAVIAKYREN